MCTANKIFLDGIGWLKENYPKFGFIMERDIVWTIQKQLTDLIERDRLPFKVYNDYPMIKGQRRSLSADLVILNHLNEVELAVEFKYEPSHKRTEYTDGKFPVTDRKGIINDITRINEFVTSGKVKEAYAIFIDEGSHFATKITPDNIQSEWVHWGRFESTLLNVSVLWTKISKV